MNTLEQNKIHQSCLSAIYKKKKRNEKSYDSKQKPILAFVKDNWKLI